MLWSVWSRSGTIDLMYLLVGNYDKNTNKTVHAKSKRFLRHERSFFCNAEYSLIAANALIYRELQIYY